MAVVALVAALGFPAFPVAALVRVPRIAMVFESSQVFDAHLELLVQGEIRYPGIVSVIYFRFRDLMSS